MDKAFVGQGGGRVRRYQKGSKHGAEEKLKNATTQGKNHSCWESTAEVLKLEACALQTEVTPFKKNVANKINVSVHGGVMVCDVSNREYSSRAKRMYAGHNDRGQAY